MSDTEVEVLTLCVCDNSTSKLRFGRYFCFLCVWEPPFFFSVRGVWAWAVLSGDEGRGTRGARKWGQKGPSDVLPSASARETEGDVREVWTLEIQDNLHPLCLCYHTPTVFTCCVALRLELWVS